tara:strand:+ start:535 stop:1506 length:972 start_codon:yes stop_codon:yes gene_type:complete
MFVFNFINIIFYGYICYLILKYLIPFLELNFISNPSSRDSHKLPTPTGGGISILFSTIIYLILNFVFFKKSISNFDLLIIFSMPMSILGILDDKFNLKASIRYIFQLITIIILILISNPLNIFSQVEIFPFQNFVIISFLIIASTAIINFINFMDGLDGLVGGVSIVLFSYFALTLNPNLWAMVGILIGFLYFNWSPSKVFMGDSGSIFIGALLVSVILDAKSTSQMLEFILINTPLIADSASCVIRRFSKNQNVFKAHKLHLYQRLNQAGWSHSNVSKLYIFSTLILTITALYFNLLVLTMVAFLVILLGIYLDNKVALKFN